MYILFTVLGVLIFLFGVVARIICKCRKKMESEWFDITKIAIILGLAILLTNLLIKASERECPECGGKYFPSQKYCEDCGYSFQPECECGVTIEEDANFCGNCGKKLTAMNKKE